MNTVVIRGFVAKYESQISHLHPWCNMMGLPGGFAVSRNEFARRVTYVKIMYVHPQPFSRRKFHGIFSVFHWFHISICKMFA